MHLHIPEFQEEGDRNAWSTPVGSRLAYGFRSQPLSLATAPVCPILYSLYDALVSINVPSDKARAVVDAMERDVLTQLAGKSDLENLQSAGKADLENLRLAVKGDIDAMGARLDALKLTGP